jgi:hypothetical protein
MEIKSIQGDIFKVGASGDYQFILIFGHIGFNSMGGTWQEFKNENQSLQEINDPFVELNSPLEFTKYKWIQFVAEEDNHGMSNPTLETTFNNAFEWMKEQKLHKIITNGIMDTNHSKDTDNNKTNNHDRVKFIKKTCSKFEQLDITLISLNDVYLAK